MRTKILTFLAVMALGAIFLLPPAHANLILNGSFESGTNPGSFLTVGIGGTDITNWSVTAGSVDYIGSYWTPSDGSRSIDLSGGGAGTMAATSFSTSSGDWYRILFDLAGNPAGLPDIKTVEVSAAGSSQQYTFDKTGKTLTNMGWATQTFDFQATGASTTLSFKSLTATAYGPALDNVQGFLVPIPGAMLLLGAGLVRLVTYSRRKKTLA